MSYREKRPPLYDDTLKFIADGLFGDPEKRAQAIMGNIIYSKTLEWEHESEYRLAIPLGKDEMPYDTLPYHAEEITEMYLGVEMDETNKRDIVAKAKTSNRV